MYIGCHLSASKGYKAMGKQAIELGANTFAFFTRNPRGGSAKDIVEKDVEAFLEIAKEHSFGKLVAHAPYTMNACAEKENKRQLAFEILAFEIRRMESTPGNNYNFHPGSHVGQGVEKCIDMIAEVLNTVLKPDQTTIVLLETMAGKGSEVGRNFQELREIIDRVELKDKLGVCFATCHVWDGGYDIVNNLDGVMTEFDNIVGLDKLKAIHINDSMNDIGSHKDRHQKIGEGHIGLEAMKRIINHPALKDKPFILEPPKDEAGYAKEIALLRSLCQ